MKPIKITAENADAIEAALSEVNGNSIEHTYSSYKQVVRVTLNAESALENILYKKDWTGACWACTSGNATANSYKSMRTATRVGIERRQSGWWLTSISATRVGASGGGRGHLTLTQEQHEAAIKRLSERYLIQE